MDLENNTYMLATCIYDIRIYEAWSYNYEKGFTKIAGHISQTNTHEPDFIGWNYYMYDFNIMTKDELFIELL